MPCRDSGPSEYEYNHQVQSRLDMYAQILCSMCGILEQEELNYIIDRAGARDWWEEHKIQDSKRQQEEQRKLEKKLRRQKALDKLTEEDKRILGIK